MIAMGIIGLIVGLVAGVLLGAQFVLTQVVRYDLSRVDADLYPDPDPAFVELLESLVAERKAKQNGGHGSVYYDDWRPQYEDYYGPDA